MTVTQMRFPMKALLVAALLAVISAPGLTQTYPNRPVRVIVPVGPGGGFDLLARIVSPSLSDRIGQPVVVENRPGAGSLVGTEAVAKSPQDGYTLLIGGLSNIAANAGLYKRLPYDPLGDFKLLSLSVTYSLCLISRKDLPQATVREVIDFARANPGKLSYASAGVGSAQHVAAGLLAHLTGTNMLHVPYKGAGAAQQDVLAGRVDLFFNNCAAVKPFIDSAQVKILAVTGRERGQALPQVPTLIETGAAPLEMDSWIGFFIGSRTPQAIIDWLRTEIAAVIATPDVATRLERDGGRILHISIAESEAYVQSEVNRWRTLIPQAGISVE